MGFWLTGYALSCRVELGCADRHVVGGPAGDRGAESIAGNTCDGKCEKGRRVSDEVYSGKIESFLKSLTGRCRRRRFDLFIPPIRRVPLALGWGLGCCGGGGRSLTYLSLKVDLAAN